MADESVCAPFNAVFRELVTTVKNETGEKEIRNAVKAAYRVWNAASPDLAAAFHERFNAAYPAVLESGVDGVPGDTELLAGVSVTRVLASIKDVDFVPRVKACVAALFALVMAAHASDEPAACADVVKRTQRALGGDPAAALAEVVLDDDLVAFVQAAAAALEATGGACGLPVTEHLGMPDGAIMSIARDISAGIDPAMLARPDGMQSLVQTVSAGIGARIGSGEIDPAALMAEATAMLKHVDISHALKMLGGMGVGGLDLGSLDLSGIAASMANSSMASRQGRDPE